MEDTLSKGVQAALSVAAELDGQEESDAVMFMAAGLMSQNQPAFMLAVSAAALAVRWHRTRQAEATVNSPAPGQ